MASGASVGLPFDGGVNIDRFFSERSATRLAINERFDRLTVDETRRNGQRKDRVQLKRILVPNTIVEGKNEDSFLDVKARIIEGNLTATGETDSYIRKHLLDPTFAVLSRCSIQKSLTLSFRKLGNTELK